MFSAKTSAASPMSVKSKQMIFALATGLSLSLIPGGNLIGFSVFLLVMLIRVNHIAFLASLILGRLILTPLDFWMEEMGYRILSIPSLSQPMGRFLSLPLAGWTRVDDSLVTGAVITAMVLWPFFVLAGIAMMRVYRRFLHDGIMKFFRALGLRIPWFGKPAASTARRRKSHKTRTGFRGLRVGLLALLIGAVLLFTFFWLDPWASRRLEGLLEKITATDVTVKGLDIGLLKVGLNELAFASKQDSMVDSWVLENLNFGFDFGALLRRRVVIQNMEGSLDRDRPRALPALYPRAADSDERNGIMGDGFSFDVDALVAGLPFSSPDAIRDQSDRARNLYETWKADIEGEIQLNAALTQRVEAFVHRPLPDAGDLEGWAETLNEGRTLAEDVQGRISGMEDFSRRFEADRVQVMDIVEQARAGVEVDLTLINKALDANILDALLLGVLRGVFAPKLALRYEQARRVMDRTREIFGDAKTRPRNTAGPRRGRRLAFPVRLYPRFSINRLKFSGSGFAVSGTDLGSDPDIIDRPAVLRTLWSESELSMDGTVTVDGRKDAVNPLSVSVDAAGLNWRLTEEPLSGLSGKASGQTLIEAEDGGGGGVQAL